jgi:hypothetical protein
MEYEESLFVVIAITVLFLIGLGIVNLIGLGVMWLRDRRTGKKRLYAVRRVL